MFRVQESESNACHLCGITCAIIKFLLGILWELKTLRPSGREVKEIDLSWARPFKVVSQMEDVINQMKRCFKVSHAFYTYLR